MWLGKGEEIGPLISPPNGVLKLNIDGVTKGKPRPAKIGVVLHNHKGRVMLMFSKNVATKESNGAKVMTVLEALHIS